MPSVWGSAHDGWVAMEGVCEGWVCVCVCTWMKSAVRRVRRFAVRCDGCETSLKPQGVIVVAICGDLSKDYVGRRLALAMRVGGRYGPLTESIIDRYSRAATRGAHVNAKPNNKNTCPIKNKNKNKGRVTTLSQKNKRHGVCGVESTVESFEPRSRVFPKGSVS